MRTHGYFRQGVMSQPAGDNKVITNILVININIQILSIRAFAFNEY